MSRPVPCCRGANGANDAGPCDRFRAEAAAEYDRAFAHVSSYFLPFVLRAAPCDDGVRYSVEQFMIRSKSAHIEGFTSTEREYIRRELDQFFSTLPTVAEGFQLNTWRGGPKKGQPKLPPPAKSLLERGLSGSISRTQFPGCFSRRRGSSRCAG